MERRRELSFLNLLFCMLVIFIHVSSWTLSAMDRSSLAYIGLLVPWRLSAFVVQGFLFLSGVKLFLSEKPFSYGKFLCGRAKKLLPGYLFFIAVYYLYFIRHFGYTFSFRDLGEYVFLGTLCSHFYYLIALAQFYLLMPLWRFLLDRCRPIPLAVGAVLLTALFKQFAHFPYDDRVFPAYLCYFLLGAIVGRHYRAVTAFLKKRILPLCGIFLLFAAADAALTVRAQVCGIIFAAFEILHLGYCLAAIAFLLSAALRLADRIQALPRPLVLADKASYYVYLSHILPIYVANDLLYRAGITDLLYTFLLRGIFTYVVTLAGCIGYILLKERRIRK